MAEFPTTTPRSLIERVKAILLTPKAEWQVIDAEPTTIGQIFRGYVVPLAAIGPVATLIGGLVFGHSLFGITYRPGIVGALITAIVSYGFALLGIFLAALVIEALAPTFGAAKNRTGAYKVAAYSATAAWVAGIFGLLPPIGFLSILGLYSLYLLWVGLPTVMKPPADKATGYTLASIGVMIVIGILMGALTAPIAALFAPAMTTGGTMTGALKVPGVGAVDVAGLEAASRKLEATTQAMQNGEAKPAIPAAALQALMPAALPGGLARTSVETSSANVAGIGGTNVEAIYGSGDDRITLTVTDMGAMGALAAMGSAFGVETSKQTGTSYERMGKIDGRMTSEKFDSGTRSGSYMTIVGDRVMVQAEGNAPSIDALKAAVASVDMGRVAALAR